MKQKDFTIPASSKTLLDSWLLSADPVRAWAKDKLEITDYENIISVSELYRNFEHWAKNNGIKGEVLPNSISFGKRLRSAKPELEYHRSDGSHYRNRKYSGFARKVDICLTKIFDIFLMGVKAFILLGGALGVLGCFIAIYPLIIESAFPDNWEIKYSLLYGTPYVHVDDKPTLCDYERSPVGKKGCHYEKTVFITLWEKSTDGNPIISYDDGKTWNVFTPPAGAVIPSKHIEITWYRKDES